ncbi:glutamate 5-kinase [Candidatus Sumerlaeota bacterium]|nr:glutamate 5-kinase [Candidatus Sumerlaeota bacterium]
MSNSSESKNSPLRYAYGGETHDVHFGLAVIKVGSMVLTGGGGELDQDFIGRLGALIRRWRDAGHPVILVSSGAVAAGMSVVQPGRKPRTIPEKQAIAAIGQSRLMSTYTRAFHKHGMEVAQILLTQQDMDHRQRYLNARLTMERLLEMEVVPIVNENDTTAIDELRFGDNDVLSARVAAKMQAGLLALLTDVGGLYTGHPNRDKNARLISVVERVTGETYGHCHKSGSYLGLGGMKSKVRAAELAGAAGAHTLLTNGRDKETMDALMDFRAQGTVFLPRGGARMSARAAWIATGRSSRDRRLIIDDGAVRALTEKKKSLLPAGVTQTQGVFKFGDTVDVCGPNGVCIARGLVNFSSEEIERIKGKRTSEIAGLLDNIPYEEVIHKDNLVLI